MPDQASPRLRLGVRYTLFVVSAISLGLNLSKALEYKEECCLECRHCAVYVLGRILRQKSTSSFDVKFD